MDTRRLVAPYVGLVAAVALLFLALADWSIPLGSSDQFYQALGALLFLAFISEVSSISLKLGTAASSVAFLPFLAAIFLIGHAWAMLIAGVTILGADAFVRRKPPIKIVFNTANQILAIGVAGQTYLLLGGVASLTEFSFTNFEPVPAISALGSYFLINSVSVTRVVSLSQGMPFTDAWGRLGAFSIVRDFVSSLLAPILAILYVNGGFLGLFALAAPLFIVRAMYQMNQRLEDQNRELLEVMVKAIEARDPYTSGHSQRVSRYARILAREMGLPGKQVEQVATAALLHDVGKIYEEFAPLLRKEGRLTPEEFFLMQTHPVRSADLVATVTELRGPIEEAVRHHHENYDGTGYPASLSGEEIPLGARIIMVADTVDAMTTDRPYRRALALDKVIGELRRFAGKQFDPLLVESFVNSAALRSMLAERRTHQRMPALGSMATGSSLAAGRRRRTAVFE